MRSILLGLALCLSAIAQDLYPTPQFSDPKRLDKLKPAFGDIDKKFEGFIRQLEVPGLVYGIVVDGELVHLKTYGVANRDTREPVKDSTVFRIASMTKSFTALAVLKLRDEGKLSLEDPVAKWIPEFAKFQYPTSDTAPIRIRQLLTHGGGFPEDNPWGDRQLAISDAQLTDWLKIGIPFSTVPDTRFEYSNYGFALLGRIVTKASGVPYSQYLKSQILEPLGMTSSTLEPSSVPEGRRAIGYRKRGDQWLEDKPLPDGAFGPMGGLLVDAQDLAKYVAYQLSAYPPRNGAETGPVRRSSQREMQSMWRSSGLRATKQNDGSLKVTAIGYGYGLGVSQDCNFAQIVGHGGGLPGFGSYMAWLPDRGVGMFAMTNLTYAGPSAPILEGFEILLKTNALQPRQIPVSEPLQKMQSEITQLFMDWDDARASRIAADNFVLDNPLALRRRAWEELKTEVGACRADGPVEPENWLRGRFQLACKKGDVDIFFTLSPTTPPKLQAIRLSKVEPTAKPSRNSCQF